MRGVQSVKSDLEDKIHSARLYCVTQEPLPGRTYERAVEEACRGGADAIQLRVKDFSQAALVSLGKKLKGICRNFGALFMINDDLSAALACGADGVHLGQGDLPVTEARKILRESFDHLLIGCSTHSLEQALKAERDGADYIGCGPIFATPTKPGRQAVGLDLIGEVVRKVRIPFFAIGGIDASNLSEILQRGAKRVAVVRSVFGSGDVESAARMLKLRLQAKS